MKKKVNSQPDTIIEFLGSQIDHETLRNILDIVEYAHVLKDDIEERAEYIKYRIDQKNDPYWQVVVAECSYGKRCSASGTALLHIRIGGCNYHIWKTVLNK
jgi:hypothetical protein